MQSKKVKFIIKNIAIWFLKPFRNKFVLLNIREKAEKKVNLNYFSKEENIGDILSKIVVEWMLEKNNIIDCSQKSRHLYAIGSIIDAGVQDATIWGSGLLDSNRFSRLFQGRILDVRAVRGPLTKCILIDKGYIKNNDRIPYGDPAVLMPLIYSPDIRKDKRKYKYSFIPHYTVLNTLNFDEYEKKLIHIISTRTSDYRKFIDEICDSEFVISTSLHGLIIAETYGVPAVLMLSDGGESIFKYYDYYMSTGRVKPPIVRTCEEGIDLFKNECFPKIDFSKMRERLINSFPYDIYK